MKSGNTSTIIIIGIIVLALIVFFMIKNAKDRKKLFPPSSTDPVEETNTEQNREKDRR